MALNLDHVKRKLEEIKKSNSSSNNWKPKAGENVVRLLPNKFNKEYPFIETYMHFKFGTNAKTYISPKTYGQPDPIDDFATGLKNSGNKEDWKLGRSLESKLRVYAPVLVRGEEDKGVQYWGFGKEIYEELLNYMSDSDYGDITGITDGRDIKITVQTPKEAGNTYGKTTLMIKPNQSPISTNKEIITKAIEEQLTVEESFPAAKFEDLDAALQAWLTGPKEGKQTSDEQEQPVASAPRKSASEISDDFDALFDQTKAK